MSLGSPAIACIGVIGRHVHALTCLLENNPLHISLFPPGQRDALEYQFMLSGSLDVFEARLPEKTADHDFGLLQAIDDRLAMYGWLTNTGVKLVIVVDMEGRPADKDAHNAPNASIVRDADFKPAFRALQQAYVRLLRNPFYDPDEHSPHASHANHNAGSLQITSPMFVKDVERIGRSWYPGIRVM